MSVPEAKKKLNKNLNLSQFFLTAQKLKAFLQQNPIIVSERTLSK